VQLIGLAGKARAGKDTAAGFIIDWCAVNGKTAQRVAFADPLKVSAARSLGFGGDTAQCVAFCNELKQAGMDIEIKRRGPDGSELEHSLSGREFLQFYGTEAHREVFGSEFWVEVTERKLAEMAGAVDVAVITDCRFPNEATMVNRHGGEVWEIVRPTNPDALSGGLEAHSSETGLPEGAVEFQLVNAGDLTDLQNLINAACEANL
jgi:hypothetical protein